MADKKYKGLDNILKEFLKRLRISDINPIKSATDETFKNTLLNFCYPVGSLYWSSKETSPADLFGGTWVQIKDKFVLSAGDNYKVEDSDGGASSATLTTENLPEHKHSFTPKGKVEEHTHTISWSGKTGNESAHESFSWSGKHKHGQNTRCVDGDGWDNAANHAQGAQVTYTPYTRDHSIADWDSSGYEGGNAGWFGKGEGKNAYRIKTDDTNVSVSGTCTGDHTHSYSGSGTSGKTTPSFTGTAGDTGNTGDGKSFSIMPPYTVKYCWERIS